MGFGLMFIGYFFVYVMSYVFIPKLVGYLIMTWAALKLSAFDVKFKKCIPLLGALSVVSIYMLVGGVLNSAGTDVVFFNQTALNIVSLTEEALTLAFHFFLMIAISSIARDTGLENIRFRSMRNLVVIGVAEIVYIVVTLLPKEKIQVVFFMALVLRLLWIILDLILLVSCYRMICEEGDEDMPEKEINIPIIKQMESIMRKRDKNAYDSGITLANKRMDKLERKRRKKEGKK